MLLELSYLSVLIYFPSLLDPLYICAKTEPIFLCIVTWQLTNILACKTPLLTALEAITPFGWFVFPFPVLWNCNRNNRKRWHLMFFMHFPGPKLEACKASFGRSVLMEEFVTWFTWWSMWQYVHQTLVGIYFFHFYLFPFSFISGSTRFWKILYMIFGLTVLQTTTFWSHLISDHVSSCGEKEYVTMTNFMFLGWWRK